MTTSLDAATDRYAVVTTSQGTALLCVDCLFARKIAITYHPGDLELHYCDSCGQFLGDLPVDAPPGPSGAVDDEAARLRGWLEHIRWGVGFYEPESGTKMRMLAAVDGALAGEPYPPGGHSAPAAEEQP